MSDDKRSLADRIAIYFDCQWHDEETEPVLAEARALEAENEKLRDLLGECWRASGRREDELLREARGDEVLAADYEALEAERDNLRETNQRLNRRCQLAESALAEKIEKAKRSGGSFGRSMANAAAAMFERQRDEAREALRDLCAAYRTACHIRDEDVAHECSAYDGHPLDPRFLRAEAALKQINARRAKEEDPLP